MLPLITAFFLGLFFSFIGSIPPGTLNITVLQLGIEKKVNIALRFSLAVAIVEYPYAWIGVVFESWITSRPVIIEHFQLITAVVMTVIGIMNLMASNKPGGFVAGLDQSGFRRGAILSILNPMAIPFWIAITAYLKSNGWLDLSTRWLVQSYVIGTSVGVLLILFIFIFLAGKFSGYAQGNKWVKKFPGIVLLVLGLYAFGKYLMN